MREGVPVQQQTHNPGQLLTVGIGGGAVIEWRDSGAPGQGLREGRRVAGAAGGTAGGHGSKAGLGEHEIRRPSRPPPLHDDLPQQVRPPEC